MAEDLLDVVRDARKMRTVKDLARSNVLPNVSGLMNRPRAVSRIEFMLQIRRKAMGCRRTLRKGLSAALVIALAYVLNGPAQAAQEVWRFDCGTAGLN